MSDELKSKYAAKLSWLECGIPYQDNPDGNPNAMVFSLAMLWCDVVPLLEKIERLETELQTLMNAQRTLADTQEQSDE